MSGKEDCNARTQFLGYVAAKIVSSTPPSRQDVFWFKPIGEDTYEVFYYTGGTWISITGSIGVYTTDLDGAIEMPVDVGGLPAGTTVSDLEGLPFSSLWDQLLFPTIPAEYETPSALLTGSNPKLLKVGNPSNIVLNASFDQADAGPISGFDLVKGASIISNLDSFTDLGAVLNTPGSITYQGNYQYGQGSVLDDSSGNPDPSGQIPAGDIDTNQVNYEWIYPWFWGITDDIGTIDIPSGNEVLQSIGNSIEINFGSTSSDFLWFAVPSSEPAFASWFVTVLNQGSIGSVSDLFAAGVIVQVASGNFAGVDYDLYVSNFSTEATTPMTISQ